MLDSRTVHAKEAVEILEENFGELVFKSRIRKAIKFAEAPVRGARVLKYDPEGQCGRLLPGAGRGGTDEWRDVSGRACERVRSRISSAPRRARRARPRRARKAPPRHPTESDAQARARRGARRPRATEPTEAPPRPTPEPDGRAPGARAAVERARRMSVYGPDEPRRQRRPRRRRSAFAGSSSTTCSTRGPGVRPRRAGLPRPPAPASRRPHARDPRRSASAGRASTRSTGWSRPASRGSSSWRSTPTCSRCSSRTADVTVHIGSGVTRGLGAGSDPELGYQAAFEEQDKIKRLLKGSDMVFITAGAGGGTGHRRGAGDRPARAGRRRAHRRDRDEAVQVRGNAAPQQAEDGRRGARRRGRHADRGPERAPADGARETTTMMRGIPGRRRRPAPGRAGDLRAGHAARR